MKKRMKQIIILLLMASVSALGADLPDKGMEPPPVVQGTSPGGNSGEPPVGSGIVVVLGFAFLYASRRQK